MQERINRILRVKGSKTPRELHRELGQLLWDEVGMSRNEAGLQARARADPAAARRVLAERLGARRAEQPQQEPRVRRPRGRLPRVRASSWRSTRSSAPSRAAATSARRARRPRARPSATTRSSRTSAAWEFTGVGTAPALHKEPLTFEYVQAVAAELQVGCASTSRVWRQAGPDDAGQVRDPTRPRTSRRTCRSSRCSTS